MSLKISHYNSHSRIWSAELLISETVTSLGDKSFKAAADVLKKQMDRPISIPIGND